MQEQSPEFTPEAPNEIWRAILRSATLSSPHVIDYLPFYSPYDENSSDTVEVEAARLKTCLSIMRVCRQWRSLAEEFLYEDIRVLNLCGVEGLLHAFQRTAAESGSEGGLGRFVRRLELPMRRTSFGYRSPLQPYHHSPAVPHTRLGDVLEFCPNLEILVRHPLRLDGDDIHFWGGLISTTLESTVVLLPRLKRLDWYESDLDIRFFSRANGRRLSELMAHAPILQSFLVSSDRPDVLATLNLGESLRTLRLDRSTQSHSHRIRDMIVKPVQNLTHFVVHISILSALLPFLTSIGGQLRLIELAFTPQLTVSVGKMERLLSRCPNLEEFVYNLGAPEISSPPAFQHATIKRVRIKVNSDEFHPYKNVVRDQFGVLSGPLFPCLQKVILDDKLRTFLHRHSAPHLLQTMSQRGCPVEYEDGSMVPLRR